MNRVRRIFAAIPFAWICFSALQASWTGEALLEVHPGTQGDFLFETMPVERTGITFESRFENPELWRSLWRQYFIGSIGSGISIGDVDGDGLPDLFLVGKDSPNALYLNRGDFRFEEVLENAGMAIDKGIGAGAAMVDIDNDGDLDIYVCYVGSPNQLFVNDGKGRFQESAEAYGLAISTGSNAPSFCDYDRDGDLDLYLQCNYWEESEQPAGLPDYLFENRDGIFVDVTEVAGISGLGQGHAAIWWDYDEDGWPDLYVANDFAPDDRLYRNLKDGRFEDVLKDAFPFAPYSAMGADLGDLNNDGKIDFMVGEMKPRDRAYYLKTVGPLSAKLFSIDPDGVSQFMQNAVVANLGRGQFADVGYLTGMAATDWTWAPRLLDLDNDGLLDAFFTNGMARAFHDADLGLRVAKATSRRQVALYQRSPALQERNLAFRNLGGFRFEECGADWGLDLMGVSFAAATGDLDGDGDLDLVVGNWQGTPSVYRNTSDKGDRLKVKLEGTRSNRFGLGARVTAHVGDSVQVRELTSMRGYMSTDEPLLLFSFRDAERVDRLTVQWPSGVIEEIVDVPTGQCIVVKEADSAIAAQVETPLFKESRIKVPQGTERWEKDVPVDRDQALLPFSEDRNGAPVAITDLDGDGWEDVVLGGPAGVSVCVLKNEGGARLRKVESEAFSATKDGETSAIVFLDYNQDGRMDILVGNGGIEQLRGDAALRDQIFLNQGGMRFEQAADSVLERVPLATGPVVQWESLDREEMLLIQAGGPLSKAFPWAEVNRIYRLGTIEFEIVEDSLAQEFAQRGRWGALLAVDLNGDGQDELVAAEQWGGVTAWIRKGDKHFTQELLRASRGYWSSMRAGDFNGDGKVDLLIGNLGLNTKYQASSESEFRLFYSRSPMASPRLFIDTMQEGEAFYPMETRTLHQMYLPQEMARTGSFEDFGKMTVDEAFGKEVIDQLESVSINEAGTLLLVQGNDGSFARSELPHFAQSGRVIDAAVLDIDGDEDEDIVLLNESLAPQPWVSLAPNRTHFTVLLNDGTGAFDAILPGRSGLRVERGQAKRLAIADLDKDGLLELIVSVSDGPMRIFSLAGGR